MARCNQDNMRCSARSGGTSVGADVPGGANALSYPALAALPSRRLLPLWLLRLRVWLSVRLSAWLWGWIPTLLSEWSAAAHLSGAAADLWWPAKLQWRSRCQLTCELWHAGSIQTLPTAAEESAALLSSESLVRCGL